MSRPVKLLIIMTLLFSGVLTYAQDNDPRPYDEWKLNSLVFIESQIESRIIEEYPEFTRYSDYAEADIFDGSLGVLSLSPDGEIIVAFIRLTSQNQSYPSAYFACIYSIDSEDVVCHLQPENSAPTYPFNVVWSSDSTRLVSHTDTNFNIDDSDLWLFDLADGSWTNLTDDNYDGSWLYPDGHYWHDLASIWHPTDDLIYFFRQDSQDASQAGIYEIAADGSSLRRVVDLSANLTVWSYIRDNRTVAISPNGEFLAINQ